MLKRRGFPESQNAGLYVKDIKLLDELIPGVL